MANEIQYNLGETGQTVYAVVRDTSGQAWNGTAFATYTTTRTTWDLALTEIGSTGHYGPIDLPGTGLGRWWEIYLQSGGSPSHTDDIKLAVGYHSSNVEAYGALKPTTAGRTLSVTSNGGVDASASVFGYKRIIHVQKDGNDSNSGFTREAAKLTITAAVSISAAGDLIKVGPGTWDHTYNPIILPIGVSIEGVSRYETILRGYHDGYEALSFNITVRSYCKVSKLTITSTITTDAGGLGHNRIMEAIAIYTGDDEVIGVVIEDCYLDARYDSVIFNSDYTETLIRNCTLRSTYDCLGIVYTNGHVRIENSHMRVREGSQFACGIAIRQLPASGKISSCTAINCDINVDVEETTNGTAAVHLERAENCWIQLIDCTLRSTVEDTTGGGAAMDIKTDYTGDPSGTVYVTGTAYDAAKASGTIVRLDDPQVLRPTVIGRTLDVTSTGEAGIDWANIGSPTTTVNLSGTTVKTATDVETDTADIQGRLPAALVSGRIDASVGAMAANTLTASALATDAVTEIQTGLATSSALSTVDGNVTTILADTNDIQTRLPAALVSGRMDSSVGAMAANVITAAATATDYLAEINAEADTALTDYGALKPTTAGRTLDVTLTGEAGIDWANIGSPTTTVNLSGTTVKTATDVETDTANIQGRIPAALVSGRIDASVGAMAADVITAAATASDYVTEVQSGLATASALTTVEGKIDTIDTNVDALPTTVSEAIFKLDLSTLTGEASRSLLNGIRFLRNKWSISGTTLTVYKEDDTTSAWTSTISSGAANPITGNDPA